MSAEFLAELAPIAPWRVEILRELADALSGVRVPR
jgi:hypothetical protein